VIKAGMELAPSTWLTVDQERIDAFAATTEDRQSIHTDPELAATGPFGTTVAHGFLTLSLLVHFWNQVAPAHDGVSVNYGLNRVRFPSPVPAGSQIRARFNVDAVDEIEGGRQATVTSTVERENAEKPVCIAELLLWFLDPPRKETDTL
jgi:acyl dehydratase